MTYERAIRNCEKRIQDYLKGIAFYAKQKQSLKERYGGQSSLLPNDIRNGEPVSSPLLRGGVTLALIKDHLLPST